MAAWGRVTRAACKTSGATTTQDITISGIGTPLAAIFIASYATTDGAVTSHYCVSYGAATGATEEWCFSFNQENNVPDTDVSSSTDSDRCVRINNAGTNAVDGEAQFDSFITDGVRIDWVDYPGSAYLLTVVMFGGADMEAYAGTQTLGDTVDLANDVTAPGFEPTLLFTACQCQRAMDDAFTHMRASYGLVHNSGAAVTQRSLYVHEANGSAFGTPDGRCTASYGLLEALPNAQLDWGAEFGAFDASGFTVTIRNNGANSTTMGYLAIRLSGTETAYVGTVSTPTATGDDAQTGLGFQSTFVFNLATHMEAIDTPYNSNYRGGPVGIGAFDGTSEYSLSACNEDGAATTDTQCISEDTALHVPEDDGTAGYTASFVSFDSDGFTLNYSAVLAAAKLLFIAAISETPTAGQPMMLRATTVPHMRQWS